MPSLFRGKAESYSRYRVDYPEAVVREAQHRVAAVPADEVADIGSGTGLLSRWFLERGHRVHAVEPDQEMRLVAKERLRSFGERHVAVSGTAEATTLPDASIDLLIVGNAFHYFDPGAARHEADRLLRSRGRVLIFRHGAPERPNAFMSAYLRFVADVASPDVWRYHEPGRFAEDLRAFFRSNEFASVHAGNHTYDLTWDELRGRFLSTSTVPRGERERSNALVQLDRLFRAHAPRGAVMFQLRWQYYWARLVP